MPGANDYCHPFPADQLLGDYRMLLLELDGQDRATAEQLQALVIGPQLELIIAAFYERLVELEAFQQIMARGFDIAALRHTQSDYLRTLGIEFDSAQYCERRFRIGLVHARVGVPLSLYLCAARMLQQLVIDKVRVAVSDPGQQHRLSDFVVKIMSWDMSLAVEAYHGERTQSLERSLARLGVEERVQRQRAQTDPLTGLASRAYFFEQAQARLERSRGADSELCLAVADLDRFKDVNDRHGHLAGDAVLREVAARLRAGFRDFDLVGRYGGEEFAVVIEGASLVQAREICERVRQRVAVSPVSVEGAHVPVTASFGIARVRTDDTIEALFRRADQALYAAKAAGRNCVCSEDDVVGG